MAEQGPGLKKLILFGVAVAVPLAAVALYFAIFDQPPPPPRPAPAVPASPAPGEQSGSGQAALPPDHPPIGGQAGDPQAPSGEPAAGPAPLAGAGHPQVGGAGRPVRIPDPVKGKWQAVKLRVEEKDGGRPPEVITVKLGGQLAIPGSKLRVKVGEFLPALQVSGGEITSASNDPTNPAVLVTVSEDGKDTFSGWLFSKFPEMQPFEHPKYRITLVEGVPRG
jgi:hypothetical protein